MNSVVALYEALSTAPDDRTRARVIAEAFEHLKNRYRCLPNLAAQDHVRESELRLQKEILQLRAEIEEIRAHLQARSIKIDCAADVGTGCCYRRAG